MKNMTYSLSSLVMINLLFICTYQDSNAGLQDRNCLENRKLNLYPLDSIPGKDSIVIYFLTVDVHEAGSDITHDWLTLNDSQRFFNFLILIKGINALPCNAGLTTRVKSKIKQILADSNFVATTNGVRHNLSFPGAMQTWMKLYNYFTDAGVKVTANQNANPRLIHTWMN